MSELIWNGNGERPVTDGPVRNVQTREGYDMWDRICKLPHYAFLLSADGKSVVKVPELGNWIDRHEAQEIVDDAQSELNQLRYENEMLKKLLALKG